MTEAIEQDGEESSVLVVRALQQAAARPTPEAACDAVMQLPPMDAVQPALPTATMIEPS